MFFFSKLASNLSSHLVSMLSAHNAFLKLITLINIPKKKCFFCFLQMHLSYLEMVCFGVPPEFSFSQSI